MTRNHQLTALSLMASLLWATAAQAQSAGTWLGRIGATSVMPQVKSDELSAPSVPNTRIDVSNATSLGGGISYMLTDNWSVDLPLALPFKSKIKGAGAIEGSGEIGSAEVVPVTVFAQYRFREARATWRPYVGMGLTYANFINEKGNGTLTGLTNPGGPGTNLKIKDKFALTPQIGATVFVTPKVFIEGLVAKSFLKTRSTLSTGQTIDVRLDPLTVGLYVGYRY
jgi:outer membrane protein